MSDFKKLLGKKIQIIRKSKGLTQEKLAELIDIETLQKLSEVLMIEPWEFYYFNEISEDEMKSELKKALDEKPKLVKLMYNFYKSIEY